jgi:hypothetical protein
MINIYKGLSGEGIKTFTVLELVSVLDANFIVQAHPLTRL